MGAVLEAPPLKAHEKAGRARAAFLEQRGLPVQLRAVDPARVRLPAIATMSPRSWRLARVAHPRSHRETSAA